MWFKRCFCVNYRAVTNLVDNFDSSCVSKVRYIEKVKDGSVTGGKVHRLVDIERTKSIYKNLTFCWVSAYRTGMW